MSVVGMSGPNFPRPKQDSGIRRFEPSRPSQPSLLPPDGDKILAYQGRDMIQHECHEGLSCQHRAATACCEGQRRGVASQNVGVGESGRNCFSRGWLRMTDYGPRPQNTSGRNIFFGAALHRRAGVQPSHAVSLDLSRTKPSWLKWWIQKCAQVSSNVISISPVTDVVPSPISA